MVNTIGTKLGNINGDNFRMNNINIKHLVRIYDESIIRQRIRKMKKTLVSWENWNTVETATNWERRVHHVAIVQKYIHKV